MHDLPPSLLGACNDYLMGVEPEPLGPVLASGLGLVSGIAEGPTGSTGDILHLGPGERPGVDRLAKARAILFYDRNPDKDLVGLCRHVGLPAVGGIAKPPEGMVVVDGLRGRVHGPGMTRLPQGPSTLESRVRAGLKIRVMGAAGSVTEAEASIRRGASGMGLIRLEHLCQTPERLPLLQQLILLDPGPLAETRACELAESLSPDVTAILGLCQGAPAIFRLFDTAWHEVLDEAMVGSLSGDAHFMKLWIEKRSLHSNLVRRGIRGTHRQGAILRAALMALDKGTSTSAHPDLRILIPFTSTLEEIQKVRTDLGHRPWKLGAMVEHPAAVVSAPRWFSDLDFLSVGGGDLAQCFWGFSRDDRGDLYHMLREGLISSDPFTQLDDPMRTFLRPLLQAAKTHGAEVHFCGAQTLHPESADFLVGEGVGTLVCSHDMVVPLRLRLSGVAA
ncbi:MAG: putative PEP-binding protein [Planctomycetota bacterium]